MISSYMAKPWLMIGVGYKAGREVWFAGVRAELSPMMVTETGTAICYCCPEIGEVGFRKRHRLAAFIRKHRNCGKRANNK